MSIETMNPELEGIGNYKFGWSDKDDAGANSRRGLNEEVVRDISSKKDEPSWMLELRLKGLDLSDKKPMPAWGSIFAGEISLHSVNIRNHTAEIGYWIDSEQRGKGIGTTATEMITELGLREIGFKCIEALVDVDNHASQKLLISVGYEKEGIMRKKFTREERGQIDIALFAATDSTWGR